jgi:hypothetical protein
MKSLSILFIQLRSIIFEISSSNIQWLKREVIPATWPRPSRPTWTSHNWSPNFSLSVMKIKIMLLGNYSKHRLVDIRNRNCFVFFHIQELHIFPSTLSDFRPSIRLIWIIDSSFPCIWRSHSLCIFDVSYCTVVIDIYNFCFCHSIVSYDQSKGEIKVWAFDRRWTFCGEPKFSVNHEVEQRSWLTENFGSLQKANRPIVIGSNARLLSAPVSMNLANLTSGWCTS